MTNNEQDLFENASVMLEVCRGAFERSGFADEAKQLRGLEATSPGTAYASLLTVQSVMPRNSDTEAAKVQAVTALRLLILEHLPLAS